MICRKKAASRLRALGLAGYVPASSRLRALLGQLKLSRSSLSSLGVLVAFALYAPVAAAEPQDGEATALAKQAMDVDYLGTQFKEAEQKLQKALKACGKSDCSAAVRARVHLDLAIVYIAGLKKKDRGNQEMQAAIEADPSVELSSDFSTPELEKAFAAAGGVPKEGSAEPAKTNDEDEDEPKAAPARADEEAPPAAGGAPRNWLSVSFQLDMLSYQETTGVCSGAAQYQCFLQGQSYGGPIYSGSGNQLKGGIGFATKRLLVGYERLFGDNLTAGVKLGFAFGGSPKATVGGAAAFLPIHAELRGSYWFGSAPFAKDGFRPYAGIAAGLAEVDGHVSVEYYEDAAGYNSGAKGTLDAWRKTGNSFIGAHLGAAYAFSKEQQLFLELRLLQMLGATAIGGAVNIGYAYGM